MICNHNNTSNVRFDAYDYISHKKYQVAVCRICKLGQTSIESPEKDTSDHYPTDYYGKETRYGPIISALVNHLAKRRINYLGEIPSTGSVLDIGCGQGWLLKQFETLSWKTKGIEISDTAAFHARNQLGLDIEVGSNATKRLESGQFDVITHWHVLEHLADPITMLSEIHRLLSDNGKVLLGVPNFGSVEARFGKSAWFHLDVPRHIFHFNGNNLKELLKSQNLKIVGRQYYVPEYDFFSFVQTLQNKLGLEMNLLYKTVRQGSLSQTNKKTSIFSWLGLLLTTPVFSALSLLWIPIALATNNGSSLILILEKEDAQ